MKTFLLVSGPIVQVVNKFETDFLGEIKLFSTYGSQE